MNSSDHVWLPELVYIDGEFRSEMAVITSAEGSVVSLVSAEEVRRQTEVYRTLVSLKNKAVLPGLVNGHSHAFQRMIRGRTEYRSQDSTDSFWTWRELMYRAANKLEAEDIYIASRMAFLEMALAGITAVGEFHYIHHSPNGQTYSDPNLLAKEVVRAASDVGLRISLLRVAYERSGFQKETNPLQTRFIEDADTYLNNLQRLTSEMKDRTDMVQVGAAPHSVRAVSLPYLKAVSDYVKQQEIPIHMHVAEQPAEVSACIEEYGRSPVALLDSEGVLSDRFTAVHAIHVTPKAIDAFSRTGATVCACPTTERNLGDGVVPIDGYFNAGVSVSLGTDSQTQIDLLEDAREMEYHLRLQRKERNVLSPDSGGSTSALAERLFDCATSNGANSIGFEGGQLELGAPADFFTIDLNDPSIAGSGTDDLLTNVVFSMSRTAVRDVVVSGKQIVKDGVHADKPEIVEKFNDLQSRLWN